MERGISELVEQQRREARCSMPARPGIGELVHDRQPAVKLLGPAVTAETEVRRDIDRHLLARSGSSVVAVQANILGPRPRGARFAVRSRLRSRPSRERTDSPQRHPRSTGSRSAWERSPGWIAPRSCFRSTRHTRVRRPRQRARRRTCPESCPVRWRCREELGHRIGEPVEAREQLIPAAGTGATTVVAVGSAWHGRASEDGEREDGYRFASSHRAKG